MKILGIHYGHNATVALVEDGRLVFALSEERLNKLKNSNGFPVLALEYVYANLAKPEEIGAAVIFQQEISGYLDLKRNGFKSVRNFGAGNINFNRRYEFLSHVKSKIPGYANLRHLAGRVRHKIYEKLYEKEALEYFAEACGLPKEKIHFSRHHASHAYAAAFNLDPGKKTLVLTMDGEGDGESSTVSVYQNFEFEKLSSNPVRVSLGYFFTEITKLLGMIPNEHEFKVMGLAPYAKQEKARALYGQFKDLVVLNGNLEFESKFPTNRLEYYFLEKLYGQRFDTIAAFAQIFLEEKVLEWVKAWVAKTSIADLALSGGVFMSVKLNQKILELSEVNSLYVMPSAADESTAIGAVAFGAILEARKSGRAPILKPIENLYLGIEYSESDIERALKGFTLPVKVEKLENETQAAKAAAQLLSQGEVVARFSGRNEWGARALGNRSILAHAGNRDTVRVINEMIKNRDFWMPFAASVLEEDKDRYLNIPKNISAPYMAITFDTKKAAASDLAAAIHPYDFTCRPQIVSRKDNPGYHELISEFKRLTGIGGILNTSFNLHGEPNVQTPEDALRTLEHSGLKHLVLGKYLVSKT